MYTRVEKAEESSGERRKEKESIYKHTNDFLLISSYI